MRTELESGGTGLLESIERSRFSSDPSSVLNSTCRLGPSPDSNPTSPLGSGSDPNDTSRPDPNSGLSYSPISSQIIGSQIDFVEARQKSEGRKRRSNATLRETKSQGVNDDEAGNADDADAAMEKEQAEGVRLREFDHQVRLTSFRFHSSIFCAQIIQKVYGKQMTDRDSHYIPLRTKLMDNVRTHKCEHLKRLEVSLDHITLFFTRR